MNAMNELNANLHEMVEADDFGTEHEQVSIHIDKKYNDFLHDLDIIVDKHMAPIIKALYEKGLATTWSCEGTWDPVWGEDDELLCGSFMYVCFQKPLPYKAQKTLPRIFTYQESFDKDSSLYGVYIESLSLQGYLREKRFDILLNWVKELPDYNVWNKL